MTPYYTCQRVDVTFTLPFWIIESVEHRDEVPWYDHTDDPGIFAHRNVHWLITIIIIKAIAILNRLCGSHSIPIAGHYAITIRSLNTIRIFWKTNKVHFIVCTSCTYDGYEGNPGWLVFWRSIDYRLSPSQYTIRIGSSHKDLGTPYGIKNIIRHPSYNARTIDFDVALLEVRRKNII